MCIGHYLTHLRVQKVRKNDRALLSSTIQAMRSELLEFWRRTCQKKRCVTTAFSIISSTSPHPVRKVATMKAHFPNVVTGQQDSQLFLCVDAQGQGFLRRARPL